MAYDKAAIARRLKSLRADKGMDQETLAALSGVSVGSIARYEIGKTVMQLDTAVAITNALGCSLEKLVCRDDG
jgi:transcriptional regulator with XRE-family HTH domain